ncbi:MAG: hypothetical protein IKD42_00020 [Kiritimatiellae bacterium]|nr:hypothetical protein [Kiritimatiellia bacterium]
MSGGAVEFLSGWQRMRLDTVHAGRKDYGKGRSDVTVLSYYWGESPGNAEARFYRTESAFRETWLHCGMMKSVVVTDRMTPGLKRFAEEFSAVEIQVEPSLVPGDLLSMSRDCDGKFASRFDTEYLLVVQDDGFPLRGGLDEFIGNWDFIGPPYVRDKWLQRFVARTLNLWTSNGGFSLRTHRMCELAAWYFKKRWHTCMDPLVVGEDAYYTSTLLKHHWKYNRTMRMADNRSAVRFAWDILVPQNVKVQPFGFHRAETFKWLAEHSSAISTKDSGDGQTVFGQNGQNSQNSQIK